MIAFSCIVLERIIRDRQNQTYRFLDSLCFFYFWFEVIVRMTVLGFSKYLKDEFNIMDLFIQFSTLLIDYILPNSDMNFAPFRIMRALKFPLKDLQSMLTAFFSSLRLLSEGLVIMLFVISLYSVAGIHIFSGLLDQRCFNKFTGKIHKDLIFCGNIVCPGDDFICGWTLIPRERGDGNNFDNFLNSTIQVLRIMTLNDWTSIMYKIQRTFTNYSWVYFLSLILVGNYFLMNLLLALLKIKYSNIKNRVHFEDRKKPRAYNIRSLRDKGLYTSNQERMKIIGDFSIWYFFKGIDEGVKTKNEYQIRSMVKEVLYKFSKEVNETKSLENSKIVSSFNSLTKNFHNGTSHSMHSPLHGSPSGTMMPSIFKNRQWGQTSPKNHIEEVDRDIDSPQTPFQKERKNKILDEVNENDEYDKAQSLAALIPMGDIFEDDNIDDIARKSSIESRIRPDDQEDLEKKVGDPIHPSFHDFSQTYFTGNILNMNNTEENNVELMEKSSIQSPRVQKKSEQKNVINRKIFSKNISSDQITCIDNKRSSQKKISLKSMKEAIMRNLSYLNMRTFKRSIIELFKKIVNIPKRIAYYRKRKKRFKSINQFRQRNLEIKVKTESIYECNSVLEVLPNKEHDDLLRLIQRQQKLFKQSKFKLDYSTYVKNIQLNQNMHSSNGDEIIKPEDTLGFSDTIKSIEKTLGKTWGQMNDSGRKLPIKQKQRVFQRPNEIVMNMKRRTTSGSISPSKKSPMNKTFVVGVMNKLVARSQGRVSSQKHSILPHQKRASNKSLGSIMPRRITVETSHNHELRLNYSQAKALIMENIPKEVVDARREFNCQEIYADIIV
jgi:hypothetical protein